MIDLKLDLNQFQERLEALYAQVCQNDSMQKVRAKAWDQFLELGLPSRKSEAFSYLKLRALFSKSYKQSQLHSFDFDQVKASILPDCQRSVLLFVNGQFQPHLSNWEGLPSKVQILPLHEAIRTYGSFLNSQWAKTLKEETDPFALLNTALHEKGVFIYLPPKTLVETPIQILQIVDAGADSLLINPKVQGFFGSQSEAQIYATHHLLSGQDYFVNQVADFFLDEEAHLRYAQVNVEYGDQAWHFDAVRAHLKRNATFKTVAITNGAATVRHDYRIALLGENAEALLNGLSMLNEKREAHTHILMDHQAAHCHSYQLFKNVLSGFSKSSFTGKIQVRQAAQKTDAFQLNNNLLLSDRAHADSKPNLEIFADDVKASHGATFGQLDAEQLFFMRARGISVPDAKNILIYSFCKEIIDLIALASLRSTLIEKAQKGLYGF
jgi:Fe-S cluster assembly protein SufD